MMRRKFRSKGRGIDVICEYDKPATRGRVSERSAPLNSSRRRNRRRLLTTALLLAGAVIVIFVGLRIRGYVPPQNSIARVGEVLPSLPVVDAGDRAVDLSQVAKGRRRIIVFYSPDCQVCERELPELFPFPPGLELLMVNEKDRSWLQKFDGLGPNYQGTFYDRERVLNRSFPLAGLPTILFVDEQGVLRKGLVGTHGRNKVQQQLKEFAGLPDR